MIGSQSHPQVQSEFNNLLNEILVKSKRQSKFQTEKKKKSTQVLHSVFKSFTNMTTVLASITPAHTHTTTGTPATDLLCNSRPYKQRGHSPSQTLNRLKKSNF